jgi:hypothetical protein
MNILYDQLILSVLTIQDGAICGIWWVFINFVILFILVSLVKFI